MASNTTPTPTTIPAPATPTTVTIVETGGQQFTIDLHDLSAGDAGKLYDALGKTGTQTNYQQLATQVAGFAKNFKSIVTVELPEGMNYQTAMGNFLTALKEGGGKLKDGSAEYLRQLEATSLGQSIEQSGIYKTAAGTASAMEATGMFIGGMTKPLGIPGAVIGAVVGTAKDSAEQIGFAMSDEQAKAMGTAYAAALYMKKDAPGQAHEANLLDKGMAWVETGFNNIWHMLPPSIAAYFGAVGKFVSNGFKDWKGSYDAALAEATSFHDAPVKSYEETLQANLANSADKTARPEAADMLRQAEHVAGQATAPVADIIEKGGLYRDQNGTYQSLSFDQGAPKTEVVKDDKGQPITLGNRNHARLQSAIAAVVPDSKEQAAGEVAGAYALYKLEASKLAPMRAMWNGGVKLATGTAKLGTDLAMGGISGLAQGASRLAGWVLPSSAGIEKHEARQLAAAEKAGERAARDATKAAKSQGFVGEALEQAAKEARELAHEASLAAAKPRGMISRAFDWMRPAGDAARAFGTKANAAMENAAATVKGGFDFVKEHVSAGPNAAQREAQEAKIARRMMQEAALGKVSQETIDASKAAHAATMGGKLSALAGKATEAVSGLVSKLPHWLGGSRGEKLAEEAGEVAAKVAPKVGLGFKFARRLGKMIPFIGVAVAGGEIAMASPAHAETVDGEKLTFREQLMKDYLTGRISKTKYDIYKQMQDHYALTGLGGLITVGILEAGQDLGSQLDKQSMLRYMPDSVLDAVRGKNIPERDAHFAAPSLTAEQRLARIQEIKHDIRESQERMTETHILPTKTRMELSATVNFERVLRSMGDVPVVAAPAKPAPAVAHTAPAKPAALTPKELHAAHEGVIEQARMAVNRVVGDVEKTFSSFNLGTAFSSISGTSIGGFASHAQTGNAAPKAAAQHSVNA